jgi:hypothetical protein
VPERDEAQGLVLAVDGERLDGIQDALGAARLPLRPGAIDVEEEVQHAPADRRLDRTRGRFHAESG